MRVVFLLTLVFVILITIVSAVIDDTMECPLICPYEYIPVCGTAKGPRRGSRPRTFGNRCILNRFNCENRGAQFELSHEGECRK